MTVARALAGFLTRTTVEDLPAPALDHAAMLIASTIASAAFGSGLQSAAIIRDLARERGGRPDASIWFDAGAKLPLAAAAQVNAVMSDAAACDDSDLRNIVHAGTPLTATSLALAERTGAGGEEVLAAIVLGYEAAGRIGEAITPGFRRSGFHGCLVAIFAAAVAAARLLRLDAEGMAQTIALSATSIGGLAAAANTSVAREYHAGLAAMLGIDAALAARARLQGRSRTSWKPATVSSRPMAGSMAPKQAPARPAISGKAGTSSPTWRSSWCRAVIRITRSPKPPPTPPARAGSRPRRSTASPCRALG